MNKSLCWLFGLLLLVTGCNSGNSHKVSQSTRAEGSVCYGGVFALNQYDKYRSLAPLNITDVTAYHVTSQIYEGLVVLNQANLKVEPGLAKSWEISEDGLRYTFHLREHVRFQDDDCFESEQQRKVTAGDVVYCFKRALSKQKHNPYRSFFLNRIKGGQAYFDSLKNGNAAHGVSGLKTVDKYTLQIELKSPAGGFLKILAHNIGWVYPREAVEKYKSLDEHPVGTGPFVPVRIAPGKVVILQRNKEYWLKDRYGNRLPYLDGVRFSFVHDKNKEIELFQKQRTDVIWDLSSQELKRLATGTNKGFYRQSVPALSVQYYGFQHKRPPFDDKLVRRAFAMAINRDTIVKRILNERAEPARYGLVPPSVTGYSAIKIEGLSFNPDSARKLLSLAGFPEGKDFPVLTLQFNDRSGINLKVAEMIQQMLEKNLNVVLELSMMPKEQHYAQVETGQVKLWKDNWVAEYEDPSNFLALLYGGNVPDSLSSPAFLNSVRYQSSRFDSLYKKAIDQTQNKERMRLLREAEQVAIDDAAVLPLYYDRWRRLVNKMVKNFPMNGLDYLDFSKVYFDCGAEQDGTNKNSG